MELKRENVIQDNTLVADNDCKYWWVYASEWKPLEKPEGYIENYTKFNKSGTKVGMTNINNVKQKDKVVFYQNPQQVIAAVGEVDEIDDKQVSFKIIKKINPPINRDVLKNDVELNGLKCFQNGAGGGESVFAVTKGQYDRILEHGGDEEPVIVNKNDNSNHKASKNPKNIILYGPPGTGKTYNSLKMAVEICNTGKSYDNKDFQNDILPDYKDLVKKGQIVFTTFHQSYGYEEFIEGIKPVMNENEEADNITYEIAPGRFKEFCNKVKVASKTVGSNSYQIKEVPTVWVVILGGAERTKLKEDCFANNEIRIGWPNCDQVITQETNNINNKERAILVNFQDKMEIGDIVLIEKNRTSIDAIGVITGPAEFDKEGNEHYPRRRSVQWIRTNINKDIVSLNGGVQLDRKTVYPLKNERIDLEGIFKLFEGKPNADIKLNKQADVRYVFIIDEINRGNISKIFGELITLIEPNKRLGAEEEMTVSLPYSHEDFGVPSNIYIIGTMNTADRSIALMDTALRRRFNFIEMMPNPELLVDENDKPLQIEGIDIKKVLETINKRIECLYDREHTIGHAFFMKLMKKENRNLITLSNIFKENVIPLLQEYFYDDYNKIRLVLGDNQKSKEQFEFVTEEKIKVGSIFKGNPGIELPEKKYTLNKKAFIEVDSYKEIYENKSKPSPEDTTVNGTQQP